MSKTELVQKEMIAAMKARDAERKESLSLLLAALKAKAKDKKEALLEAEEDAIILKEIKQAEESLAGAEKAARADLIEMNRSRIAVLSEFAPADVYKRQAQTADGMGADRASEQIQN